ncbi:rhodanese-like domain-containing protein [Kitasatospora sp. NPDC085879]|uniref:rhodanese-like domain-containing protein n=1 Tax=Kitasatospora sp. NPDC085879 TaxID=3154769 RepID=UPI000BB0F0E4|nr:rhodanese-like domain-containing protein [Streptomyces sp. TLI_235]PBC72124.1 rhodanese-related sulfurtransferase [Streptomyces sp. TLI_235]
MTCTPLSPEQALARAGELTVVDVRTPGEYAAGHLPGALNVPLDALDGLLPALRSAADRGDLLLVCASGARSGQAAAVLAGHGVDTATLTGGTAAWAQRGHPLERAEDGGRAAWAMDRQVRLAAGSLVLAGLAAGLAAPKARWLSAAVAGGLAFSAATDTCGMAAALSRLPHNRPRTADLAAARAALAG